MSGAAFILAINLLVAGLFCATFVLIALHSSRFQSARWFAAAYGLGAVNLGIEATIPLLSDASIAIFFAHTSFTVVLVLVNVGLARRYDVIVPRSLHAALVGSSMVVIALIVDMPRDSLLRLFVYQAPYAVAQLIGISIILRAPHRRLSDRILAGFLSVSAAHFLSKPLLAIAFGGTGSSAQDYLGTTYAMFSMAMGAGLAIATALLLLSMLITDVLRDVTERSETDPLSGLFNRRGFEQRLGDHIARRVSSGLPLTLVLADLDHFKQVNDNFGHAIGDRLIAEFAASMRKVTSDHHILGRIGGEEFAAVLPGSNHAAGRLFAEAVRTTYAAAAVVHLPASVPCSASFGVAETVAADTYASLMERADAALYDAKRDGRDCVRVAPLESVVPTGIRRSARLS